VPLSDALIDFHLTLNVESFEIVIMQNVALGSATSRGGSQSSQLASNNYAIEQFKALQLGLLKTNQPLDACFLNYVFSATSNVEKSNSLSALILKAKTMSISADCVTAEGAVRR
jgi:hypothetical protein